MGMGIDVGGTNQDYSYLFQGLAGGGTNLNYLSDYASIKNGSYGKLLKSYYGSTGASGTAASQKKTGTNGVLEKILEEKKNPKVSKEAQQANSKLTSGISTLANTVSTLQDASLYSASEDGTSAADKVVSAVKNYVSQYNDVISAAKDSTLTGKTSHVAGMMRSTEANAAKLAEIGVTLNRDGTLQINEGKLKTVDLSKVQDLFSKDDVTSYGSTVKARLGFASASSGAVSSAKTKEEDTTASAGAAALKEDLEKLTSTSLFERVTGEDGRERYDVEKLFAAVKSFVGNYNSMLDGAGSSGNSGVIANLARIREKTAQNKEALGKFGIGVDENGKLSLDGEAFRKSDMSQLQQFFQEFGPSIATNVSLVNYYMTTQANSSSGYTASGAYNAQEGFRYDVTQ